MRALQLVGAVLFGAALAVALPVVADYEEEGSSAAVVHGDRVDAKISGDGQARAVPMAQGRWAYLGELSLEAGAEYNNEAGAVEQYLYVLTGSAVLKVEDHRFFIGPRMGVYIPTGADVQWANGPDELVAVQFFVGKSPGVGFDDWYREQQEPKWPPPPRMPRPDRSEISVR